MQSDLLDNIPPERIDMQKKNTLIENRLGTVGEIADIVATLAGKAAACITGQFIGASDVSECRSHIYAQADVITSL